MNSPNSSESLDVAMAPSIENNVYFCVAKGGRILQSYNGCSSDRRELDALAGLCLESAPPFHSWYSHTAGARTFGFLMEDGYTYFAIVDPSLGNLRAHRFLESIRDGFKKSAKNGVHDELLPVIRSLIASLASMPRPAAAAAAEAPESTEGPMSTKAPLLGKSSSCSSSSSRNEKRAGKDRSVEARDVSEDRGAAVRIDVPPEPVGAISLQKSSSLSKGRGQQMGRRKWCRHVKIVILADALLCLVLFGIWLAVCQGFQCVSSR